VDELPREGAPRGVDRIEVDDQYCSIIEQALMEFDPMLKALGFVEMEKKANGFLGTGRELTDPNFAAT
jgi:hypothetical protein